MLPGGSRRQYVYDPLMRLKSIMAKDPGQNVVMGYQYSYDKMDNIIEKATEHGPYDYGYDDLYRLTVADNPEQTDETYSYDGVGNRLTSAEHTDWGYNTNNELQGYDRVTFLYDANGNTIEKNDNGNITKYFYNIEDRLVRVEDGVGDVMATYYYDPFGRRLWKEVDGMQIYFVYSDEGLDKGQCYFYQNDRLGTPQKITSLNGAVVWSVKYSAFGEAEIDPASTVANNMRFVGQYFDQETGFHYNYHRYYHPKTGRFFTPDPIGFAGGINLYAYVLNNPINWIDPYGLKLYNIVIKGGGINVMGHNLTMHIDDRTGKVTYYEVTGPNKGNVHVYERSKNDFIDYYNKRLPELSDKNFNEISTIKGKYDVVEVKGVGEQRVINHLEKMHRIYKEGEKKYPYEWNTNNCTSFSYRSYREGGILFSPDPNDIGEAPWVWPRDLNQAIMFHNQ